MPISTGLPRQSLIFCRALLRVMIFREIFLVTASLGRETELPPRGGQDLGAFGAVHVAALAQLGLGGGGSPRCRRG